MKKNFIYYSYTGNGELVASILKEKGYEIRKVSTAKNPIPKNFFFGMLFGGMLAGLGHKSKLINFDTDISEFDSIVIGFPVWNSTLSCPANSMLSKLDLKGKSVTFIAYSGSGEGKTALRKLNRLYKDSPVIFIQEPKKYPEIASKLLSDF